VSGDGAVRFPRRAETVGVRVEDELISFRSIFFSVIEDSGVRWWCSSISPSCRKRLRGVRMVLFVGGCFFRFFPVRLENLVTAFPIDGV